MIGELAALGVALSWAVSSLLLKPLSGQHGAFPLNTLRLVASALFFAGLLLALGKAGFVLQTPAWSAASLIIGTFIGAGLGDGFFIVSLRYLEVSQAYALSICGYPLVTLFLAAFFLGERLSGSALLGVMLVVVGIFLIAFPRGGLGLGFSLTSPSQRWGLFFTLLTILTWGVATAILKYAVAEVDVVVGNFIRLAGAALLIIPLAYPQRASLWTRDRGWRPVVLGGLNGLIAFGLGGYLLLVGLQQAGAAKTSILASTSPLFLVPLAVFFLKEKVTAKLLVGVIFCLVGIVLILL